MRRDLRFPLLALALLAFGLLIAGAALAAGVHGTVAVNNGRLQGATPGGLPLLNAPDPVQSGSSISHWDPTMFPNTLMEPAINPDLPFLGLDITPAQMQDIGWTLGTSNVNIFPLDPPGTGFTDPRPFGGAPGNPATTLGDARINLFNAVLGAWAETLDSGVDIDVLVTWQPLFCGGGAAVLGAAGTTFIIFDDSGALPFQNTWYPAALAEALVGADVTGPPAAGGGDIIVFMNTSLDDECLAPGTGWYYGLDGNNPTNQIDMAPVVLHEIGHGLGFANFTDELTGAFPATGTPGDGCENGCPSVYDLFTLDTTTGKTWDQMSDAERVASAVNVRKVAWNGPNATTAAQAALDPGVPELVIDSPAEVAGTYNVGTASFGGAIPAGGLTGNFACFSDDVPDITYSNACTSAVNPGELAGKIALIDRGGCAFTTKVKNAQDAGAIGAIVVNNAGNTPLGLGGSDPSITIPAVSLGRTDGNRLRRAACPGEMAYLGGDRFQVMVDWAAPNGLGGAATAVEFSEDTALFTFSNPDNVELVVKVLDACDAEHFNSFWVFAGGLTNVEVTMTVVDTQTGQPQGYFKPQGPPFQPIQDTQAFQTCP